MTRDRGDTRISKFRHPIRWFRGWLDDPARTNADALLAGVIGTAAFSAVGALAGILLSAFDVINFGGNLSTSLAAAAGGFCLATGIVFGVFLVRRFYYRPRLNMVEAELAQTRDEVSRLAPLRHVTKRHEAYVEHIHQLLGQFCGDGFVSEADSLLVKPARIIEEATGIKVRLSIWTRQKDRRPFASERWTLEFAPEHTESQRKDFGVPLKHSWIAYMAAQKRGLEEPRGRSRDFVFGINDLDHAEPEGHDLTAFQKHGFRSLRGTTVVNAEDSSEATDDKIRCLVALSEQPEAFAETEDWYITFLGQIFSLHQDGAEGGFQRSSGLADWKH